MKKFFTCLVLMMAVALPWPANAANLLEIYKQAFNSDPTFQAARATWLAAKESLPLKWSAILPSVDLEGIYNPTYTKSNPLNGNYASHYNTLDTLSATVTEPIFNLASWAAIQSASASVKQATATYNAALQDLMMRTATAYFNVLQAYDTLRFTEAEKRAIGRQLEQTQERYKVGLIAITDVYETRASYQSTIAQEIAAKNALATQIEALRQITNHVYPELAGIRDNLPLIPPDPTNINQWVDVAIKQNYSLQAAKYGTLAAKRNINVASLGAAPTVTAASGYNYQYQTYGQATFQNQRQISGTLTVNFPVVQGGYVLASARQADYLYQQTAAQQESTYRSVVADARNSYLGVIAGISQTRANNLSILSNESALKATEAGYIVGTRTIIDVLNSQSALYQAQTDFANSQYQYLLNILKLKEAAGTLGMNDLATINSWLGKSISLAIYQKVISENSFAPDHLVKPAVMDDMPVTDNTIPNEDAVPLEQPTITKKAAPTKNTLPQLPAPALTPKNSKTKST